MNLDSNNRRVVVTGYGMITPLGRDAGETFGKASSGASGIDYIRSFDTSGLPCRIGGEIDDSWVKGREDEGDRRFYKLASRALRLMLIATREATALARLYEIPDRGRIGVALGSHGDNPSVENMVFLHRYLDGNGRWDLKGLMNAGG